MLRPLSTVTPLVDASVFTALVRLCEYENTACPSLFVIASLPTMKRFCTLTFVSAFISVVMLRGATSSDNWDCLSSFAASVAKSSLSLAIVGRCILVLIAGRVQTFTELLHSVVVPRGHRSRHCPNRSLMLCHAATSCQPHVLSRDRITVCSITKASPILICAPSHVKSIDDLVENSRVVRF